MNAGFWLGHHRADELHRTYAWGSTRVCARCVGTYPALFAALTAQLFLRAPLESPADWVAVGLVLPALVDWVIGRQRPRAGSNGLRTLTGVLLGLGLGRTLYVHFQRPFPLPLVVQLGGCSVVVLAVLLVGYRKRVARRPGADFERFQKEQGTDSSSGET